MMRWIALSLAIVACSDNSSVLPCSMSIASYCAQNACSSYPPPLSGPCGLRYVNANCGAYIAVDDHSVDTGAVSYYDRATGMLVAVVSFVNTRRMCEAGPSSGFAEPTCSGVGMNVCDAGTD